MKLSKKLPMLMQERGVKSAELARLAGVAASRISEWVNAPPDKLRLPTLSQALRIARVLRVPMEYLADDEADDIPPPDLTDEESELLRTARRLEGGVGEAMRRILHPAPPKSGWVGAAVVDMNPKAKTYDPPKPPIKPGDVIAEDKLKPPRQSPGKRDDDGRRKKSG